VITVDGALQEAAWENALQLTLRDVVTGAATAWPTTVRVLWDTAFLYVAFTTTDRTLANTMAGHDQALYQQDVVELFIDPDGDGYYYYELEWNCLNAVFDLLMAAAPGAALPPGETVRAQLDWAASGSRSAVRLAGTANDSRDTDSGMTVEIALAWADFARTAQPLPPRIGDTLRLNFYRIEYLAAGGAEYSAWSPTAVSPAQFHVPAMFGKLVMGGPVAAAGHAPAPAAATARGRTAERSGLSPAEFGLDGRRVRGN